MPVETVRLELGAGERETYICNWKESDGSLPKGHDRILKKVICRGSGHWLAATFALEGSNNKRDDRKDGSVGKTYGAVFYTA